MKPVAGNGFQVRLGFNQRGREDCAGARFDHHTTITLAAVIAIPQNDPFRMAKPLAKKLVNHLENVGLRRVQHLVECRSQLVEMICQAFHVLGAMREGSWPTIVDAIGRVARVYLARHGAVAQMRPQVG